MASESSLNPLALIAHLVAIGAGLYLGWIAMGAIAPDLPGDDVAPGVSSSAAPEAVAGGDPDSLFRAENLRPALDRIADQLGAGETLQHVVMTPGSISAPSGSGYLDLEPEEIPADAPERIVPQIAAAREAAGGDPVAIGLDDVGQMTLAQAPEGPRWLVQLSLDVDPPRTATATLDGSRVTVP